MPEIENFRTLCVDPGEDVGWSIWRGPILVGAHTTKMWPFADDVWKWLNEEPACGGDDYWVKDEQVEHNVGPIGRIVCEDFRIYPWEAKNLAWDQVRTARLIGALTFMARNLGIEFHLQPAAIKKSSVAAGAEEFFYTPLHENRHANDSIMHGWYYAQFGEDGQPDVPNNFAKGQEPA